MNAKRISLIFAGLLALAFSAILIARRFGDPETFAESGRLAVFDGSKPVENLNELELVEGQIYANVAQQDRIAIIQPDSGQVVGWANLAGLRSRMPPLSPGPLRPALNGIAYDAAGRRLFVTGKLWPKVFEVRLTPLRAGRQSPRPAFVAAWKRGAGDFFDPDPFSKRRSR